MRIHDLLEAGRYSQPEPYRYIGNCTNPRLAPYLEDMIDAGRRISYRRVIDAVGKEALAGIFSDFFWGERPRPGDMRLWKDPYVTFNESKFNGIPCLFIQESAIEYVFVPESKSLDCFEKRPKLSRWTYIQGDGTTTSEPLRCVFSVRTKGNRLEVSCSTTPTRAAAATLERMIGDTPRIVGVLDEGDEKTVAEFVADLHEWVDRVQQGS